MTQAIVNYKNIGEMSYVYDWISSYHFSDVQISYFNFFNFTK